MKHRRETVKMAVLPGNRKGRGRLPELCMEHRHETVERAGLPGNRRDKDTRRTRRGTSRVRGRQEGRPDPRS